jgi:nitrogen-specific signal transduction histidine kinase
MEDSGRLAIEGERRDGKVLVRVIDSWTGLSDDLKGRLFTPFVTTKPRSKGTGLGLDIVKRVVEAHGGSVGFTSHPGRTVFEVLLPSTDGIED